MKKTLVVLIILGSFLFPNGVFAHTTVHFLDVGQGDCTIVQSAGETLVIDTGSPKARAALAEHLNTYDINHIDTLVLTHPHDDHDGSFGFLVNSYEIGTLYMPEYADDEEDYGGLLRQAVSGGTQIRYPAVGDQFTIGDATITILSAADPGQYPDDRNLWSIVSKIEDGATSVIIMGDAEDINEYAMIDAGLDLDADILRVGHHGSNTSTTGAFVEAVSPDLAIISCGAGNSYGHPHEEPLDTLTEYSVLVMRTDLYGTIQITSDGTSYRVNREKGG